MTDPSDIEAMELDSVHISTDGRRLRLRVRDQAGRTVRFTLPANWLNSMLKALPRSAGDGVVHPLDSWSLDRTPNGHQPNVGITSEASSSNVSLSFLNAPQINVCTPAS